MFHKSLFLIVSICNVYLASSLLTSQFCKLRDYRKLSLHDKVSSQSSGRFTVVASARASFRCKTNNHCAVISDSSNDRRQSWHSALTSTNSMKNDKAHSLLESIVRFTAYFSLVVVYNILRW